MASMKKYFDYYEFLKILETKKDIRLNIFLTI